MKHQALTAMLCAIVIFTAGASSAANFVIVNGDGSNEGLNDPTPVAPVGGNSGTTLGEQRMNVLVAVADRWAARLESPVDIVILARFNILDCNILGSTGPGDAFMNFPGAPVPDILFHGAIADSISGVDQDPGSADFYINYNSGWDGVTCASSFYYGLDGNEPAATEDLFPVVLHEMGHGLGFASFANPANGVFFFGDPGIFDYYTLDMTTGLHWNDMNNTQRAASAINDGNLVWDGPNVTAGVPANLFAGAMELEVTSPPAVVGVYDALGAGFGGAPPDEMSGDFELANTGTATPTDGCVPLIGFTPGRIAFMDRGNCEFGLKALNAENAGASAAVIANDRDGTTLVLMGAGDNGGPVTIPVVALGEDDGNLIRPELPGVSAVMRVNERIGVHASGRALLYGPTNVAPGSSVSHWDVTASPDLLMEPFTSPDVFDQLDLTPAQFKDVGHTVTGFDEVFADGFETGDATNWDTTAL